MDDRIPNTPPLIAPVPGNIKRPRWSVMIPSYNCSDFLTETIQSVLVQDPGPEEMQIEVVDDCSTDADVASLVKQIGNGRVEFFRQEKNRGSLRNFETCLNRSRGHWIHLLHGDDMVNPGFYNEIGRLFNKYPEAGAAFTGYTHIDEKGSWLFSNKKLLDEDGILPDWLFKIAKEQRIQPPAIVVKRSVYEQLGSFFAVHYGEDWEMWVRIAAHFPVAHSPKQLAQYRIHNNNITSRYFLSGQSMSDVNKIIDIIQGYIPEEKRKEIKNYSRKHFSKYFALITDRIYHNYGRPDIALSQAKRAMQMHLNPTTFYFFVKVYAKLLLRYKMKTAEKPIQ
jgi:glycosyltransferase involved in cell wall biosynthesis